MIPQGQPKNHHQSNLSKLLECQFSYESKESTRDETYEDLQKIKANLRRKNYELKKCLQRTKQEKSLQCLGIFYEQLKQLSQRNQKLRDEYEKIYKKNKPVFSNNYNSEPLQELVRTPKSRKSVVSICQLDNSFKMKESMFVQSQVFNGRKSLKTSNIQNVHPKQYLMRKSLKMNDIKFRENDQLTQRKSQINYKSGKQNLNLSMFSQSMSMSMSMKNSVKCKNRTIYPRCNKNIFVNFVDLMLKEEKQKENNYIDFVSSQDQPYTIHNKNQEQISSLQNQVRSTFQNIEKLTQILHHFEIQIKEMEVNISSVTQMTGELTKVKKNYLLMQEKCKNLGKLQTEVNFKQNKLKKLKQNNQNSESFMPPVSVQMLLRLMGIKENLILDPYYSKRELKNIIKGNIQKPSKKRIKVKQLLDSIREGRKKFKELMGAYEAKIKKIERKITSLRFQEGKNE